MQRSELHQFDTALFWMHQKHAGIVRHLENKIQRIKFKKYFIFMSQQAMLLQMHMYTNSNWTRKSPSLH